MGEEGEGEGGSWGSSAFPTKTEVTSAYTPCEYKSRPGLKQIFGLLLLKTV